MTISELSVRRPVTITMVYLLICVIALIFVPKIGVALYPTTSMPILSVSVDCVDIGPEEVEEQVTKVLENRLSSISGLESMTSTSAKGSSRIMLEFGYDVDLDEVSDDISAQLNRVASQLPSWASTPSLFQFDMSSMPIMRLMVKGSLASEQLKYIAEETIQPLLERVDGVASVEVAGGTEQEISIAVSQNRLEAYGLTLNEVAVALSNRNIQGTGGNLTMDDTVYEILMDERFGDLDEIRETIIATMSNGVVVRLQDIAEVALGYESGSGEVYIDGVNGLMVMVTNTTDSNDLTVAKAITTQLAIIQEELPQGVSLQVLSDDTSLIEDTMSQVYGSALQGGILAMFVIFLFLRGMKSTLIIGLSMPISILITLLVMSLADVTINTMSMTGLILGMGMIVDASIVVLENIHGYRQKGHNAAVAAILGSREMFNAIVASTSTTLCVFIPVLIYRDKLEMMGQMFQDLALTVVISLTASLFVAITLVPALAGSILQLHTRAQKPLRWAPLRIADNWAGTIESGLERGYAAALRYAFKHRLLIICLIGVLLFYSLLQFSGLGMNMTPSMATDDRIEMSLTLANGTSQDVTRRYAFEMQALIEEQVEGYTSIITEVGSGNTASITLNLPAVDEQTVSASEIQTSIRTFLSRWPEASWSFSSGRGPESGSVIDIEVRGDTTEDANAVIGDILNILATKVPQVVNLQSDLSNGDPRIEIVVDQELAADLGIGMDTLASTVEAAVAGKTATTFVQDSTTLDVVVSLGGDGFNAIEDLGSIMVAGSSGSYRLDSFASFNSKTGPKTISRENKQRVNHVTASLADGYVVTEVQGLVEEALATSLVLPDTVTISYSGEAYRIMGFGGSVIIVIIVALFLVYAVMAAQFESLLDPLIMFISIPLLLIGVIWIHVFLKQPFSLYSAVGIVALVGIVVNNGIVLIDSINRLVMQKVPVEEACLISARSRLKPILMTTLTTVLGMVPIAFFPGSGGELMQPIGITIVGGLTTGAFLTLFLSPILYSLFHHWEEKRYNDPQSLRNQLAQLPAQLSSQLSNVDPV